MNRNATLFLRALVCAALCAPAGAFAQYFISLNVTPTDVATCDTGVVTLPVSGTLTGNLPNSANNTYEAISLNGGAPAVSFDTAPFPSPFTVPVSFEVASTPSSTSPPYTIVAEVFPAQNGVPTGQGVRLTGVCGVSSASLTIETGILAQAPVPVPALPRPLLAALGALLALAGMLLLRRRRRDGG